MKPNIKHLMAAILILAFTLTACNLPLGNNPVNGNLVETVAAATISALFTQTGYQTQAAQMTQEALVSSTPWPTNTPFPTFTPIFTATSVPPTITPVPPTATPIPIPCNASKFMGDVTIEDWSVLFAGEEFTKTWQVKNVGTCSWTKDYKIFFYSGDKLEAPDAVAFPKVVNPGETVNLSVDMVTPNDIGKYTGSWMLKSANGAVFGVGSNYNVPMTVNIKVNDVPRLKDPDAVYDFTKNYCEATWRTNDGILKCPSTKLDFKNGSITRTYSPVLEGGYRDDEGALITVPASGDGGWIRGKFPGRQIKSGDYFATTLSCGNNQAKCSVTFELLYNVVGNNQQYSLGKWVKDYGDPKIKVLVDLSGLAGEQVNLYLKVTNNGNSTDDMAMWLAARITRP